MSPSPIASESNTRRRATVDVPPGGLGHRRPATRRRASQDHRGFHSSLTGINNHMRVNSSLTDIDGGPRRATQGQNVFSSLQSDCMIRLNSIRFRHDEPDWNEDEDSSYSGDDSYVGSRGMEVMDLRTGVQLSGLEDSSLTSFSSNSMDSELKLASGHFQVAGSGGGDAPLRCDMPKHWAASGDGKTAHSYRTIMSLVRSGDNDNHGSFVSWSALAAPPGDGNSVRASGSGESCGSSYLWDEETSSKMTESSPLTNSKKWQQRRKLYVRRCARAIVGFVVLAALSGTVCYLVSEKDHKSMLEFLPGNNLLGRSLGNGNNSSEEQQEENDDQLMYRRLPQGGNVVEIVSTSGNLGNDNYDKDISPQEREHRARGQLILAQEHRVQVQREARVHEEHAARRKTMAQDEGYYNSDHQDYPTARQENDPYQEYHQEYNGYPLMEEGGRVMVQEDEGYSNVHQDHYVHQDHPENVFP